MHPETQQNQHYRTRCGISALRSELFDKYEMFASKICANVAPRVFKLCLDQERYMRDHWGWAIDEERYESPETLQEVLRQHVAEVCGRAWSDEFQPAKVLTRSRTRRHFEKHYTAKKVDKIEEDMIKPINNLNDDLRDNLAEVLKERRFSRIPLLCGAMEQAVAALLDNLVDYAREVCRKECAEARRINDFKKSIQTAGWADKTMGPESVCTTGVIFEMCVLESEYS